MVFRSRSLMFKVCFGSMFKSPSVEVSGFGVKGRRV